MWYKSVYPTVLTWPNTRACVALSKGTQARHMEVSTYALFSHGLRHGRVY
ncbi:hypothetical protein F383_10677 [Gossypium arboreum]|uniref:Uncharacterized protein n=1 Tax=Gossypium arboreum TaxID=29729 RepID=A0A0B0PQH1_GOSAR|nr:hypothetical protein F383_10677 [Gossypium arboreum]